MSAKEQEHRREKRILEARIAIDVLKPLLHGKENPCVLEFGSGAGVQADLLCDLGDVVASDLDPSSFNSKHRVPFVECDISKTPFESETFNLICSNHVVEHLENVDAAYAEIRRVGKPDCIYAFSVPTNLWLVLTIPSQLRSKLTSAWAVFKRYFCRTDRVKLGGNYVQSKDKSKKIDCRILKGHGTELKFSKCYRSFKVDEWRRTFEKHGFEVLYIHPLLLYGPSEFPLIPTTKPIFGKYASSVLFVLKQKTYDFEVQE